MQNNDWPFFDENIELIMGLARITRKSKNNRFLSTQNSFIGRVLFCRLLRKKFLISRSTYGHIGHKTNLFFAELKCSVLRTSSAKKKKIAKIWLIKRGGMIAIFKWRFRCRHRRGSSFNRLFVNHNSANWLPLYFCNKKGIISIKEDCLPQNNFENCFVSLVINAQIEFAESDT